MITVSVHGLRVFGRHGVHAEEREHGQDFLFDVDLDVGQRGLSDRLDDAVDYGAVARAIRDVSDAHAYSLLEALAAAVADELRRRFGVERATVRVTKPAVKPGGIDGVASVTVSLS